MKCGDAIEDRGLGESLAAGVIREILIYDPSPSGDVQGRIKIRESARRAGAIRGVGVRETVQTSATFFPHPDPAHEPRKRTNSPSPTGRGEGVREETAGFRGTIRNACGVMRSLPEGEGIIQIFLSSYRISKRILPPPIPSPANGGGLGWGVLGNAKAPTFLKRIYDSAH